ncbi:hypothetical protein GQ53DRAFT_266581 [Thozetella sp. PMI_491]|nr:hypothetical protein GQ53DRAFT_266581 [Thozetella sp. PMI_491]
MSTESPELLDAFKAAALSVTKLYKISAVAQSKARSDGYQDCLEDLLAFLDRENIGSASGDGLRVRKWVADRVDGREASCQGIESEDEAEKSDAVSSPEVHGTTGVAPSASTLRIEHMRDSAPPTITTIHTAPTKDDDASEIVPPAQETFTFQSQLPYPQETHLNIASLDLSDSRTHDASPRPANSATIRGAARRTGPRTGSRTALGRGAGQKRKVNLAEIFDLGSLGYGNGKDMFGGGKRGRFV